MGGEPMELKVSNITPYLVDADNVLIVNRPQPICNVPEMSFGSMPNDDGNFLLSDDEKAELIAKEPGTAKFIRPLISAREFLNDENRWCLWMVDASPADIRAIPEIMKRVEAVRKYRLASKRDATKKLAEQPTLFGEIRQPDSNYVLIPSVVSRK